VRRRPEQRATHARSGRAPSPPGLAPADIAIGGVIGAILVAEAVRKLRAGLEAHGRHLIPVALLGLAVVVAIGAIAAILWRRRGTPSHGRVGGGPTADGWATRRELSGVLLEGAPGDRVVIGRMKRSLVVAERLQSVLVVGPSQSGKTTSLAIPAVLDWAGPVLATSVKTDLVRDTIECRSSIGEVAVFDPTAVTGLETIGWSPLSGAGTWAGARRVADSLCSVGRRDGAIEDASYWYAAAERLIAPLLRAAALASGSMGEVVRWLDEETVNEPLLALELAGERDAARVARSCFAMEERQRSSVYATAQTVVAAYADPHVADSERASRRLEAGWLLGDRSRTLYCSAPARDQRRLSPIFVALVRETLDVAFEQASRLGKPLDPPLLVVLDEAANIAPLSDIDQLLATAAGHGVSFVTVWQDLAQIEARYGPRWATIVNNHRAKVVFPGVSDPRTLELLSVLIGDSEQPQHSRTTSKDGSWSETQASGRAPVAPAGWIRRMPAGSVLLVYGGLPPALLDTRPWFSR
jgi:type IV secretion system protein VirD4